MFFIVYFLLSGLLGFLVEKWIFLLILCINVNKSIIPNIYKIENYYILDLWLFRQLNYYIANMKINIKLIET